jgi:hypothetical protein
MDTNQQKDQKSQGTGLDQKQNDASQNKGTRSDESKTIKNPATPEHEDKQLEKEKPEVNKEHEESEHQHEYKTPVGELDRQGETSDSENKPSHEESLETDQSEPLPFKS